MRRFVVFLLTFLAVTGTARGADVAPPAPEATPAPFSWSGFYFGANGGYGWVRLSDSTGTSTNLDGALVGGQSGVNWQAGNWVLGMESDAQATWQAGETASKYKYEILLFTTARLRAGVALDRHLLYATGGAALVLLKLTNPGASAIDSDLRFAWTVGGGWEWMFLPKLSAKLEYLYLDTGNTSVTLFGVAVSGRGHDHILRAGLNFHL